MRCAVCGVLALLLKFIVAGLALEQGDPYRLIYGHDSFGNSCGRGDNPTLYDNVNSGLSMRGQKKLFYHYASRSPTSLQMCVSECPQTDNINSKTLSSFAKVTVDSGLCLSNATDGAGTRYNPYHYDAYQTTMPYTDSDGCPEQVWASLSLMNRCLPVSETATDAINGVMDSMNAAGVASDILSDFNKAYQSIMILLLATMVVAILIVFTLRYTAYILIWVCYWALIVMTLVLGVFLWYTYAEYKRAYDDYAADNQTPPASAEDNVNLFLALAIAWTVLGAVLIIVLAYMRSRVALVVALFQEAGDCLGAVPLLLLYPILTFLEAIVVITYFGYILAYLWTAGTTDINNTTQHASFSTTDEIRGWYWYHLFGFFWTFEMVLAFQEAVVAGVVAEWYFTRPCPETGKKTLAMPIARAFARTLRFSLGSILAGAFIIAVVKMIRFAVWIFEDKIKQLDPSSAAKFCIACVKCVLWCFERCIKFHNRNAYIEIAITGKSFCSAAIRAFDLLLRNALRVAAINSIGDFVLLMAKFVVIIGCTVGAFFWFRNFDEGLTYEAVCILAVALFAYGVATMFIGIYEMAIDTIFMAFCEDSERNDGSCDKPFFM